MSQLPERISRVVLYAFLVGLLTVACASSQQPQGEGEPTGSTPSVSVPPSQMPYRFQVRQVRRVGRCALHMESVPLAQKPAETCDVTKTAGYHMGPAFITLQDVVAMRPVENDRGEWVVFVELDPRATRRFAEVTSIVVRQTPPKNQLAMLWIGSVQQAVTLQTTITGGSFEVGGFASRDEAEQFARLAGDGG